jgi:hypothetical protein
MAVCANWSFQVTAPEVSTANVLLDRPCFPVCSPAPSILEAFNLVIDNDSRYQCHEARMERDEVCASSVQSRAREHGRSAEGRSFPN